MYNDADKMEQARALLNAERYDEARYILESVELDEAQDWLDRLDEIAPEAQSAYTYSSGYAPLKWHRALLKAMLQWGALMCVVFVIDVIIFMIEDPSVATPIDEPSMTMEMGTTSDADATSPVGDFVAGVLAGIILLTPIAVPIVTVVIRRRSKPGQTWTLLHLLRVPILYPLVMRLLTKDTPVPKQKNKNTSAGPDARYAHIIQDAYTPRFFSEVLEDEAHENESLVSQALSAHPIGTTERTVQAYIVRELINIFGYKPDDIETEFSIRMGSSYRRADVVIFGQGAAHVQENIVIIVECKKVATTERGNERLLAEAEDQLKSYMAACINARFGAVAGAEWRIFERVSGYAGQTFHPLESLPGASGRKVIFSYHPG